MKRKKDIRRLGPHFYDAYVVVGAVEKLQVDAPAHEAATSSLNLRDQPTQAQIRAGNYRMGHLNVGGLDITIENPAQSVRRGVDSSGTPWTRELTHHYGYIRRTVGADGDHVDCLVCVGTDDGYCGPIWIVDQHIDGEFDEHKCLIGWPDEIRARSAYLEQYQPGWKGLENITQLTMDQFKDWLQSGDTTVPLKVQRAISSP
jgi:inorganic pyrophosphatase-like protein